MGCSWKLRKRLASGPWVKGAFVAAEYSESKLSWKKNIHLRDSYLKATTICTDGYRYCFLQFQWTNPFIFLVNSLRINLCCICVFAMLMIQNQWIIPAEATWSEEAELKDFMSKHTTPAALRRTYGSFERTSAFSWFRGNQRLMYLNSSLSKAHVFLSSQHLIWLQTEHFLWGGTVLHLFLLPADRRRPHFISIFLSFWPLCSNYLFI